MEQLGLSYYGGLLSAAQYHGAAHHQPQGFQVVTRTKRRAIACGAVRAVFVVRKRLAEVQTRPFDTVRGTIQVSTVEATAVDLVGYPHRVGGLEHAATVIAGLAGQIDPERLVGAARTAPMPWAKRLGYLLDLAGEATKAEPLKRYVRKEARDLAPLVPSMPCHRAVPEAGWKLAVNAEFHIHPPARHSEDIDLVQVRAEPIGSTIDALRAVPDPWLGKARWKQNKRRVSLSHRFESEDVPPRRLRLKVEIDLREHFTVFGLQETPFAVSSCWFEGEAPIKTYTLDELVGTKLHALYQRRKGRDLFDLATALKQPALDPERAFLALVHYMAREDRTNIRALFERNLASKLKMPLFTADIGPLLAAGYRWEIQAAAAVSSQLVKRLPGDPWKGE